MNANDKLTAIRVLCTEKLPDDNYEVLKFLIEFLLEVFDSYFEIAKWLS